MTELEKIAGNHIVMSSEQLAEEIRELIDKIIPTLPDPKEGNGEFERGFKLAVQMAKENKNSLA